MTSDNSLTLQKLYAVMEQFVFADEQYKKLNVKLQVSEHVPASIFFYLPKNPASFNNAIVVHPQLKDALLKAFSDIPLFSDEALATMLACRYDQHRMKVQGWPSILQEILPPEKAAILIASEPATNIPGGAPGDWYVWPYLSTKAASWPTPAIRVQFYNRNLLFTAKSDEDRKQGYLTFLETAETS